MRILMSFMLISLILIMNGHMFQSAKEHNEIGVRPASATWYPISISKCVLNPYLDNLDNSIMETK